MTRAVAMVVLAGFVGLGGGCLERTVTITSTPPGAVVWLNDVEVGRTPVTTGFTFYGVYDVRLRREGFEPVVTTREAAAPIYEYPPVDFVAEAVPARIRTRLVWDFELVPVDEAGAEVGFLERAREMQERAGKK